jgi:LemA protein
MSTDNTATTNSTSKTASFIGATIIVIVVIVAGFFFAGQGSKNSAIKKENMIEREQANVQTIVQKRVDALTQMINTVKESKKFEQDTLTKLTDARSKAQSGDISSSGTILNATAEAYPELKTIDLFTQVNQETTTIENQLSNARQAYNTSVRDYKNSTQTFPNSVLLSFAGYQAKDYQPFTASSSAQSYDPSSTNLWDK